MINKSLLNIPYYMKTCFIIDFKNPSDSFINTYSKTIKYLACAKYI